MKNYAIILAAGKGTRFGESKVNKTAVKVSGQPLIRTGIIKTLKSFDKIFVVIGHKHESVENALKGLPIKFITQNEQLGTGHATKLAIDYLLEKSDIPDNVFITNGDHLFMIDQEAIDNLIDKHIVENNDATVLTTFNANPENLTNGRIVKKNNKIIKIIEKNEFDKKNILIKELNTGTYIFKYAYLYNFLKSRKIVSGQELYITDACVDITKKIQSLVVPYEKVGSGVNTKNDLKGFNSEFENIVLSFNSKKSNTHRLVELLILLAILSVIIGKIFFGTNNYIVFLLLYGLIVTIVMWSTFIIAFFVYKDPYFIALQNKKISNKDSNPLVSCMVAVRNEEDNISRCIDSMIRQTYSNIEIIIVNDASTDNTLKVLEEYTSEKKIKIINLANNVGKKHALSAAMSIAKGTIYAHTDSDSVWAPDAIEKIVEIFKYDKLVGAVSGHGRALNGDKNLLTKIQDSWMEGQFSARKAFESVFNAVTCVSGPLAVFRKEAIYNLIPAWENDQFLGQEFKFATDRTLTGLVLGSQAVGKKLKDKYKDSPFNQGQNYPVKNWKVTYCNSAKSWTIVPDTFAKLIKQQVRWKKSFIRNIFFTGSFYWREPLPTAIVYYFHIILVFMGPYVSFRHLIYLPLHGNIFSAVLYLSGILFVGFMFGLAHKLQEKNSHRWVYRPLMSLLSTLMISWLIIYSIFTIRKMTWTRS